ncbi:adenosine deaminase [uncultured Paraglaciecola sp.]|uniref:adenosine deaminase family protein n=1 Tax=uncultured Paraglaciecola sp. TaxID=1765024 RepID=UPI0025D8711E|nr:adenosine deaminase [uncultured Paraglaciecola sp.]
MVKVSILRLLTSCLLIVSSAAMCKPASDWFSNFKNDATPEQLYHFLYMLPKGGDLHNHLGGSNFSEWWYELATQPERNGGYRYYTRTVINLCNGYGTNEFNSAPQSLMFRTIQHSNYNTLSECEKSEYRLMNELNLEQKTAWLNSIRLNKDFEGRSEFFERHWSRLNDLGRNPIIAAEMIVKNMQAFAEEGLTYLETQISAFNRLKSDGSVYSGDEVIDLFRQRLTQYDAIDTGVTTRLQQSLLRFSPDAEENLKRNYRLADSNRDILVGLNMVGREDNDKGYPLRFLKTFRELRQSMPAVKLAIHAGEVDEPNFHVRDTLLLGADRIGHGINLIDDPQTMLLMRNNKYLVEINLVSNLLLEYVSEYSQHPFPEYLRTGIPVALSTDDRGMWDSTMTDEYFVAVKEFNLSWQELISLGENSLIFSFVDDVNKQRLLKDYAVRVKKFADEFQQKGIKILDQVKPNKRLFICQRYQLCN